MQRSRLEKFKLMADFDPLLDCCSISLAKNPRDPSIDVSATSQRSDFWSSTSLAFSPSTITTPISSSRSSRVATKRRASSSRPISPSQSGTRSFRARPAPPLSSSASSIMPTSSRPRRQLSHVRVQRDGSRGGGTRRPRYLSEPVHACPTLRVTTRVGPRCKCAVPRGRQQRATAIEERRPVCYPSAMKWGANRVGVGAGICALVVIMREAREATFSSPIAQSGRTRLEYQRVWRSTRASTISW